ncbi:branched-chain amino acid ABC transporter permease [Microbacterium sp. NPDC028030]|uniref:branched-chain amino acid ABC transporter permease n=1 Tax=Microbacterium sp. NPDC028030 TaxID=3155124 RepID=UPI0033E49334
MTDPQLWLSVLEIGSFFGLIALAYQLTLIGAGFFNFAIGPYAMAAALGASWLTLEIGLPIALSLVLGLVIAVVASGLTELLVVRQVQKRSGRGELPALVAVTAVLFIVQQGAGAIFGRPALPGQVLFSFGPWQIGSAYISGTAVVLIVATALIFLAVSLWMRHSRTGRLLRAVGDNRGAAALLGLPVGRIRLIAFLLAGLIAGAAGLLYAPKTGVAFTSGLSWTLVGFLALVIGGTGRTWAPLLGGFVLGAIQVFAPFYFGSMGPTTMVLLIALLFFAFRPQGLFSTRVRI